MLYFRQDDNTLWSLFFELTKFFAKQFTGPGKWAPGAGGAFAPRVRTAVEEYWRHNTIQPNDAPVQDIPLRLMISLARKANERRPLMLDPNANPSSPTTLTALRTRIREIFNFPPHDWIESLRLNCDDGREITMTDDADFQRIQQQQGPEVMLSVVHVHVPPLDGGIDDVDHATYYPVGADADAIFGMPSNVVHAPRTQEQQERLINHVKHLGRNGKYTRPPTVDAATREAADGDDTEGGRAAAVAQAEIQAHRDVEEAPILSNSRIEELQARSSPYNDMRYVLPILRRLLRNPATPNELHPIAKGFHLARSEQARTIKYKAHQIGALTWMLENEAQLGGGIITDKAGTGKTILIAGNIQASVVRHKILGKPTEKPTLVAMPAGLVRKTVEDLHNMTRTSYRAFMYGVKELQRWTLDESIKHDVLFDPTGIAFVQDGDQLPRHSIVVVSLEQLSILWDDHKDGDLEGFFDRIILDEGNHVRRCELTKRGALLRSVQAGPIWLSTQIQGDTTSNQHWWQPR